MQTPIGRQLRGSPGRLAIACVIGIAAITGHLVLVWIDFPISYMDVIDGHWLIAVAALAVHLHLVRGDLPSVGLIAKPIQSWKYWVWATLFIGLAVLCCIALGLPAWVLLGQKLPIRTIAPKSAGVEFFHLCIVAPILEETIYRLALCVPFAGLSRPWTAVIISGVAFGALHIACGNPAPNNLIAGFFLAWAYLKSGSIYIPILLHSLGNFLVWAGQVALWYWMQGIR